MLVLGIETSCDETCVSLVEDGCDILSNEIASSMHLHKKYGGVIPEIACRCHVEWINYTLKEALEKAGVKLKDIDLVAVTSTPGLVGALLVGISQAKAISYCLQIPIVQVNHICAHIYSVIMGCADIKFPCIGVVVSGGHTVVCLVEDYDKVKLLGQTRDDAVGEAFDKAAKVLELGYPGGPFIEREAEGRNSAAVDFPRAYLEKGSYDFSFSGVKTALLYYVRGVKKKGQAINPGDICASFQKSVFDVIVDKSIDACINTGVSQILLGGGVSANQILRQQLIQKAKGNNVNAYFPSNGMYTDNAAMVAGLGFQLYKKGVRDDYSFAAQPQLSLS